MSVPSNAATSPASGKQSLMVTAGSRLHFGLFSFGRSSGRQYGGAGLMIEAPALTIRFTSAAQFRTSGCMAQRIADAAESWLASVVNAHLPGCEVEVIEAPPQHIGLGSGTQLASAVVAGLAAWQGVPITSAHELAKASGRAARSAVGTHGFLQGGLIVEEGKQDSELAGDLLARRPFPEQWRVLLMWPPQVAPVETFSGEKERTAFRRMPAVTPQREAELRRIASQDMLPAVELHDFDRFSRAMFAYNHGAGECYRTLQGGAYASSEVARLIEWLRSEGIEGVGQSSWGPLVFAFAPSEHAAIELQQQIAVKYQADGLRCEITSAMNAGAAIA